MKLFREIRRRLYPDEQLIKVGLAWKGFCYFTVLLYILRPHHEHSARLFKGPSRIVSIRVLASLAPVYFQVMLFFKCYATVAFSVPAINLDYDRVVCTVQVYLIWKPWLLRTNNRRSFLLVSLLDKTFEVMSHDPYFFPHFLYNLLLVLLILAFKSYFVLQI